MKRFVFGVALAGAAVLPVASAASAATHSKPVITSSATTFAIPSSSPSGTTWTLNLWSHGTLVGTASGSSGELLTVSTPTTPKCKFQADVSQTPAGGQKTWYSGAKATLSQCGGTLS